MLPDELIEYLKKERKLGVEFEVIKEALKEKKWSEEQINEASLWYSQHTAEYIKKMEKDLEANENSLPDLQGVAVAKKEKESPESVDNAHPQIPDEIKPKQNVINVKFLNSKKDKDDRENLDLFTEEDTNQENHPNVIGNAFKMFLTIILLFLLGAISFSLLITYDILDYQNEKFTPQIKNFVLGLSFTPKTSEYVVVNTAKNLIGKPLQIHTDVRIFKENGLLNSSFNVDGKILISPGNTKADLVSKKDEKILRHITYDKNHLVLMTEKLNYTVFNKMNTYLKIPVRLKTNEWIDFGEYKIPYVELAHKIFEITKDEIYFSKKLHMARLKLNNNDFDELTEMLKDKEFEQLTQQFRSGYITLNLTDDNKSIDSIEINLMNTDGYQYTVNIKVAETEMFEVKTK